MNTFKIEVLLKYSAKDIFNIFTKSARLNFPNFNEKKSSGHICTTKIIKDLRLK